jgi:hypothetical protein
MGHGRDVDARAGLFTKVGLWCCAKASDLASNSQQQLKLHVLGDGETDFRNEREYYFGAVF